MPGEARVYFLEESILARAAEEGRGSGSVPGAQGGGSPGPKDVVSYDQYDLFFADGGGDLGGGFSNSPSPDCEKSTLAVR